MDTLWEYSLKNGIKGFFDVNEISHVMAYEYDDEDGGCIYIHTKDGQKHEISGHYSELLTKKATVMLREILDIKRKINKTQQYD